MSFEELMNIVHEINQVAFEQAHSYMRKTLSIWEERIQRGETLADILEPQAK